MTHFQKLKRNRILPFVCALLLFLSGRLTAFAEELTPEERIEQNKSLPVQSNIVPNWPSGPVVSAEAAILIEAETGTVLYAKNIHKKEYPASMTKILTTLIATEQCELDEVVKFSHDAVFDTPRNSNHIAMDVGQKLTVEQCLNAILIRSANEVSFALAEHISGTSDWSVFAAAMNQRAKELGALHSNFVNPNGLPDEDHYTTAYDIAMIGKAFFSNELLCKISLTKRLEIPVSDTIKVAKIENSNMQIIPGGTYAYEYLVGCKTGYTDAARACLVSCAEKDGMRLICVVMKDENPYQYEDTISLFNYGFSNFEKINVSQTDTKYNINDSDMFYSGNDIFGSSRPMLTLNKDDYIILPRTASLDDLNSSVTYQTDSETQAAVITYTYHGVNIGSVSVNFASKEEVSEETPVAPETEEGTPEGSSVIFINIVRLFTVIGILAAVVFVITVVRMIMKRYSFSFGSASRRSRIDKRRRGRSKKSDSINFDFDK